MKTAIFNGKGTSTSLTAAADRGGPRRGDQPGQGLRPDHRPRPHRRGLRRHGRAPRHQGTREGQRTGMRQTQEGGHLAAALGHDNRGRLRSSTRRAEVRPGPGQRTGSQATSTSTASATRTASLLSGAHTSGSRRAPALPGTTTPRDRPSMSPTASATSPAAGARCRRSARVMSSTSNRARSTGTERPPTGSWHTSRSRKPTTTARS